MDSLYVRCVTVKSRENEWLGDWVAESKSRKVEESKSRKVKESKSRKDYDYDDDNDDEFSFLIFYNLKEKMSRKVEESKSRRVEEWKSNFLLFCFFKTSRRERAIISTFNYVFQFKTSKLQDSKTHVFQ